MFNYKKKLLGGIIRVTYKKCTVAALTLAIVFSAVFGTAYVGGKGTIPVATEGKDWGISFNGEEQPRGNASVEELLNLDTYFMGKPQEKIIYLTFDCGYENGNTEAILDALKSHDVSATFFVVGHYLDSAEELVKRMAEEGHTVANHTYHHPDMSSIKSENDFKAELQDLEKKYTKITGRKMAKYYRPPQGKYSPQNLELAKNMGYKTFFWSLAHVDWIENDQPAKAEAIKKLTERIHPGAVLLLHNTSSTNAEILDELLTIYKDMGYTVKPLSHLVKSYK